MRGSTVAWQAMLLGSVVAIAATTHPAQARNKHPAAPSGLTAHAKGFAEHGKAFPADARSSASSHGAERTYAGGRPVVFHPGSAGFNAVAPAGRYQITLHGSHINMQNGVFYSTRSKHSFSKTGKARFGIRGGKYAYGDSGDGYEGGGSLQCVPFARAASGIELKGNAANWWYAAAGIYERGNAPEPGSVLNFRSTGHMRLGHVAVVSAVIGSREIEVDHANWAGAGAYKGGVARGVHVVDVSPDNDWSAVRVALPSSDDYGSVYPTYGFIYDRPDNGTMVASRGQHMNVHYRTSEVAEAPDR